MLCVQNLTLVTPFLEAGLTMRACFYFGRAIPGTKCRITLFPEELRFSGTREPGDGGTGLRVLCNFIHSYIIVHYLP